MIALALKTVLYRKNRLVLTGLAIVLGVAFVTSTFALSASIRAGAEDTFAAVRTSSDLTVRRAPALTDAGADTPREPIDASRIAAIRGLTGVAAAEGAVTGQGLLGDPDGAWSTAAFVGSANGLGTLSPFRLTGGRAPVGAAEVALDAGSVKARGLRIGDRVVVQATGSATAKIVGTVALGDVEGMPGLGVALFDLGTAQALTGRNDAVDEVVVEVTTGADRTEVMSRILELAPDELEVVLSGAVADEQADKSADDAGVITLLLGAFGVVAMVVGGFVILNTFTVTLAQRTQELGLLRAVGASRAQVTRAVLGESAAVGVVASMIGVVTGLGLAVGLRELASLLELRLPDGGFVVTPRTLVVPFLLGVVLTLSASAVPARRAGRLSPMAALKDVHRRVSIGRVRIAAGIGLLAAAAFLDTVGVVLAMVGTAMLAPALVPVAVAVARPFRRAGGVSGRLGLANARRNPVRTGATASALMIGLSLVVGMTVVAASMLHSFGGALDRSVLADFIVSSTDAAGITPDIGERLRELPQVAAVSPQRGGQFELEGIDPVATPEEAGLRNLSAVDPETYGRSFDIGVTAGDIRDLADGGVIVLDDIAERQGWHVGDTIRMRFAKAGVQELEIDGLYGDDTLESHGFVISLADYSRFYSDQLDTRVFVSGLVGVDADEVRKAIESVASTFPGVRVDDPESYTAQVTSTVDLLLGTVNVLLGLAVLIAVLGIVNTLALSMHERTRELGLVRAVGMTKRQVRSMVRWESVVMSLLGSLLGVAVGVHVGRVLLGQLGDTFGGAVTYPVPRLALLGALGALVGLAAAVLPARRAANTPVLDAVKVA